MPRHMGSGVRVAVPELPVHPDGRGAGRHEAGERSSRSDGQGNRDNREDHMTDYDVSPGLVCPGCGSRDVDLRRGLFCGTCAAAILALIGSEEPHDA